MKGRRATQGGSVHEKQGLYGSSVTWQALPACDDPDVTLGEYAPRWVEEERHHLRARTIKSYEQLLNRYIVPALGRAKLRSMHAGQVKGLLAALGIGANRTLARTSLC